MEADAEVDALIDSVNEASARYDLPAYVETHRATAAQDLWRIQQLIRRRPDVRFNGDFSHLYCGGEVVYPGFDQCGPSVTQSPIAPTPASSSRCQIDGHRLSC